MPITLVDENGNEIDIEKADGGTLRKKLEEALKENKTLSEENATFKAGTVIEEHGFSLVKPEELAGVPVSQLEAKGKELQEQHQAQREELVRSVFEERGLEGDDLDTAVKDLLGGGEAPGGGQDSDFTGFEDLGGSRPSRTPTAPPMTDALGNLTSHFEETAKRKK